MRRRRRAARSRGRRRPWRSGQEPPAALLRQINSGGSETVRHVNWDAAIGLGSPSLPQDVEPWAPARGARRPGARHRTNGGALRKINTSTRGSSRMTVMLATFMEVLDTSVANVALPHIAGNLSATRGRIDVGADLLPGVERHHPADGRLVFHADRPQALLHDLRGAVHASARCSAAWRPRSAR